MPDSYSNVLHDIKISELPVAAEASASDQLEANQSGTTRSITLDQVSTVVAASDQVANVIFGNGPRNVASFGVDTSGVQSDPANLQVAIDWALADMDERELYLAGDVWLSADVTGFHDVHWTGPGSVRIASGPRWYVEDNAFNTTSALPHTLYVAPTGSGTASGLAPEYPTTLLLAIIIARRSKFPLSPLLIQLAEGGYPASNANNTFSRIVGAADDTIRMIIQGPTPPLAWNNTVRPPDPLVITGITVANPPVVTYTGTDPANGDRLFIALVNGMTQVNGSIYTVANVNAAGNTFELSGVNGSGWSARTSGGYAYATGGTTSSPTAFFYGNGVSGDCGLRLYPGVSADVNNIHFVGCSQGIQARGEGTLGVTNVHCSHNEQGVGFSDYKVTYIYSGHYYENGTGIGAVNARGNIGLANPGMYPTTTPLIRKSTSYGLSIWEGGNGHFDGMVFEDNVLAHINVQRNGHCVALYNKMTTTTATRLVGYDVWDNGILNENYTDFTGAHVRWFRGPAAVAKLTETTTVATSLQEVLSVTAPPALPSGGTTRLLTYATPAYSMARAGQGVRVVGIMTLAATTATLSVVIKMDGVTVETISFATLAVARKINFEWRGRRMITGNGFVASEYWATQRNGSTFVTSTDYNYNSRAMAIHGGVVDFTVDVTTAGADAGHAAILICLEKVGW